LYQNGIRQGLIERDQETAMETVNVDHSLNRTDRPHLRAVQAEAAHTDLAHQQARARDHHPVWTSRSIFSDSDQEAAL